VTGLYLGLALYGLLAAAAVLLASPFLAAACLLGGPKWRERCGRAPRTGGPAVWVHAASVGEVIMVRPLLDEIGRRWPGRDVAISTMTGTGRDTARMALGEEGRAFFFPVDFFPFQLRALSRLSPEMVVVCETELWPGLMWLCWLRGIPFFLVNARLSARSLPWYRALRFLFGPLLERTALIACQTEDDAARFASLAGRRAPVMVAGNMKYDGMARPPSKDGRKGLRGSLGLGPGAAVLVAGSTRDGEEELVLEAWKGALSGMGAEGRGARLILAPRHPDRFEKVAGLLEAQGLEFSRRSRDGSFLKGRQILLWDTLGELAAAYSAGDLAFVGGSLVPVGGHNPLEPASVGLPVIFGQHMFNAAESARCLLDGGGAVQVGSAEELGGVLRDLMGRPERMAELGGRALAAVESRRGAARRTAEAMARCLVKRP